MKRVLYTTFLVLFGLIVFANPPFGGGGTGGGDEEDPDNDVPIDGSVAFLILSGTALGARYLFKKSEA